MRRKRRIVEDLDTPHGGRQKIADVHNGVRYMCQNKAGRRHINAANPLLGLLAREPTNRVIDNTHIS